MHFLKVQGTGNDFALIDGRQIERDWPKLAVAMCDRHFGVGADGILLVLPSAVADVRMRVFNADGSEAEMCGNGVRCVARYAIEHGLARGPELAVETLAGIMRIEAKMHDGVVYGLRVNMGRPRLAPQEIPVALEAESKPPILNYPLTVGGHALALSFVSMGNPHAVHFIDNDPDEFPLEQIGPLVERHPLFPRRTNFEVVQVLDRGHMKVRVWERGAGITLACGTGACAAMVAARLLGLVDDKAEVALPGGALELEWDGQGDVYMSGPAEVVFEGEWRELRS